MSNKLHGKDKLDEQDSLNKKDRPKFIDAKRRGFLQGAAVASGVAATGAAAAASEVIENTADAQTPSTVAKGKGYELTDHVRKYYKKARF